MEPDADASGTGAEPPRTGAEPTAEHSGMKAAATKREVKLGFLFFAAASLFVAMPNSASLVVRGLHRGVMGGVVPDFGAVVFCGLPVFVAEVEEVGGFENFGIGHFGA